jgi:hypothetical protein
MTILVLSIVLCLGAFIMPAQSSLKLVFDHDLTKIKEATFDTLVRDVHSTLKKYGFAYEIGVFKTEDEHAQKVYSLRDFADVDKINAFFDRLPSRMGEKAFQSLFIERTLAAKCDASAFFTQRNDLSYKGTGNVSGGNNYVVQRYYYTDAGRAAEVEKQIQQMASLYKRSGVTQGFTVAVSDLGTDQPIYLISYPYTTGIKSYRQKKMKTARSLSRSGQSKLLSIEGNLLELVNKYEEKRGYWSQELAYKPR